MFLPYINHNGSTGRPATVERGMSKSDTVVLDGREVSMAAVRNLMDDELCEAIHGTVDTEQEFLDAYLAAHEAKYGEPFVFA